MTQTHIWRCEHARFCVEDFLCAIYKFSFIHSFTQSANFRVSQNFFTCCVSMHGRCDVWLVEIQTHKRFKTTLIYYDTDTQSANFRVSQNFFTCCESMHGRCDVWPCLIEIQTHKRFKRTFICYDIDTQSANFRGNPLRQVAKRHLTVNGLKTMKNEMPYLLFG